MVEYKGKQYPVKIHSEKEYYGMSVEMRSNYGCTGSYFYSFYTAKDHRKISKKNNKNTKKVEKEVINDVVEESKDDLALVEALWSSLSQNDKRTILEVIPELFSYDAKFIQDTIDHYVLQSCQ